MIITFSYGRDVVELFAAECARWEELCGDDTPTERLRTDILETFQTHKIPDLLAGRLLFLLSTTDLANLGSVMVYRGNEMPMCSCLYTMRNLFLRNKFSYVQVAPGDFELAVAYPDAAKLYDCPRERIESLRRQFAAVKAVITRRKEPHAATTLFDDEADPCSTAPA